MIAVIGLILTSANNGEPDGALEYFQNQTLTTQILRDCSRGQYASSYVCFWLRVGKIDMRSCVPSKGSEYSQISIPPDSGLLHWKYREVRSIGG